MNRSSFCKLRYFKLLALVLPAAMLFATACSDSRSNGSGGDQSLTADPDIIDFGYIAANQLSSTESISLINSGSASITIESIRIGEASDAGFDLYQVPAELPLTLGTGVSEVISVYFAPAAAGNFLATIEIATDESDDPVLVLLGGCSTSEDCEVDFTDLDPSGDDDDDPVGDDDDDDDDSVDPSGGDIEVNPMRVPDSAPPRTFA